MRRALLVTNDFPPKVGGIQSYLRDLCALLPAQQLTVLASSYPGDRDYDRTLPYQVVRFPRRILLPTPGLLSAIVQLVETENIDTVWFGAAAPLAVLARPLRRRCPQLKLVASTHGHEVGWSMLPGSRQVLRIIGDYCDTITYVSKYARNRFAAALGPTVAMEALPGGVDCDVFSPELAPEHSKKHTAAPTVICVSRLVARKGQDKLIAAWPEVCRHIPNAQLQLVGAGPDEDRLRAMVQELQLTGHVTFDGRVPDEELPAMLRAADLFAMPVRTRGGGLDVEGLGIVYLEAQACGTPVLVGNAGGAPETLRDGVTGKVVDGTDVAAIAAAIVELLSDRAALAAMSTAAREWALDKWSWQSRERALRRILGIDLPERTHG